MKMSSNAKSTTLRLLSGLTLIAAVTLGFAPSFAWAGGQVRFQGVFDTTFQSQLSFPILTLHLLGEGNATHLGLTAVESTNEQVNLLTGAATATCRFTAANGDQVEAVFTFDTNFDPSGTAAVFAGSWEITQGGGRFTGASGSGTIEGWGIFTGADIGVGHFILAGTISSPGSLQLIRSQHALE